MNRRLKYFVILVQMWILKTKIVKIGEHLLRKGLSSAPSTFTLHGKTEDTDVKVDPERVYTIGGSSALNVLDLDGNHRPAVFDDLDQAYTSSGQAGTSAYNACNSHPFRS